jgi:putative intracellular protease/amidase
MYLTTLTLSGLSALVVPSVLAMPAINGTQKPLRVGVLFEEVQMSDLVGLDFFGSQTPEIMSVNVAINPAFEPLMEYTTPMEFLYISSSPDVSWVTPKMIVKPQYTYEDAPRDLDILLLGGPNPATVKESSLSFLKEASKQTKVIMTTCTGAMWLARSGVLDGKKATTNRVVLDQAKKLRPEVNWQEQRWVIEKGHFEGAEIWTSGGAGCGKAQHLDFVRKRLTSAGIDMIIEYSSLHFNKKLTQLACLGLEFKYENRSQFYDEPLVLPF